MKPIAKSALVGCPSTSEWPAGIIPGSHALESMARTFERRETTVHDQLEIAQLALGEHDGGESLGLSGELGLAGSIAGEEVLEDTTVGGIGHCV